MEENLKVLDELSKGACMGVDAIKFIMDKIEDPEFKESLETQLNKYHDIEKKIQDLYQEFGGKNDNPQQTSLMNKAMTWYGIEMKTLTDTSNSKIAELLMQGTNMGIIEGRKLLNHKDVDEKINQVIEEYVTMQEDSVENLKKYL